MAFERLVGLQVDDQEAYTRYREAMMPILLRYGGGFGYDFHIAEVLRSATPDPINRVFTIHFPSEDASDRFFADPEYIEAKRAHFEGAVTATTILAAYERP